LRALERVSAELEAVPGILADEIPVLVDPALPADKCELAPNARLIVLRRVGLEKKAKGKDIVVWSLPPKVQTQMRVQWGWTK